MHLPDTFLKKTGLSCVLSGIMPDDPYILRQWTLIGFVFASHQVAAAGTTHSAALYQYGGSSERVWAVDADARFDVAGRHLAVPRGRHCELDDEQAVWVYSS